MRYRETACMRTPVFVPTCSSLPRGSWGLGFRQSRGRNGLSHTEEKRQGRGEGKGCKKSNWLLRRTIWTNVSQEGKPRVPRQWRGYTPKPPSPRSVIMPRSAAWGCAVGNCCPASHILVITFNGLFYWLIIYWGRGEDTVYFVRSLLCTLVPGKKIEEFNASSVFFTEYFLSISFCPY